LVWLNSYLMIKEAKFFILLMIFSGTNCFAQQLSSQVLLPAAGEASSGQINYSQSIGETAVEIFSTSDYVLTQGFQQPGIADPDEKPHVGTGVEVYPNPAKDFVRIKLYGNEARKFRIELLNITGRIYTSVKLDFITKYYYIQEFDITDLMIGIYIVSVKSTDGLINRSFKIEKM
jgi:hypothetical protein